MNLFTSREDRLFEKATSDVEDVALNLDIADQIKGKEVHVKTAAAILKRRLSSKNPNTVLLALKVLDLLIFGVFMVDCG